MAFQWFGSSHEHTERLPNQETQIMLLEPKTTLNTGNVESERTVRELERI